MPSNSTTALELIPFLPQLRLLQPDRVPDKWDILFRYDPAVLIVDIRWHENTVSVGELLQTRLHLSYAGNRNSVSLPYIHGQCLC